MLQNARMQVQGSDRANPKRRWMNSLWLAVIVGTVYFLAAKLGLSLLTPDGVAVFWPAAGVAAGALIALGPSARLAVVVGTMVATIVANLMGDRTLWGAVVFAFCNAGEALLTAALIERCFGSGFSLDRLRHVLGLLGAAIVGAAVSGIGGTLGFVLFHGATLSFVTWQNWFASDALGIITSAPLVIGLAAAARKPPPRNEAMEGFLALAALTVISLVVVSLPAEPWTTVVPIALLFPLILWVTARCRPVFAAAAAFLVTIAIVWNTTFGIGYFGDPDLPMANRVHAAQAGILTIALCAYVLAALFAERRRFEEHQGLLIAELDHRVKNLLARVAVVIMYTRQGSGSLDQYIEALDRRIQSMADAHSLLSRNRWHGVDLTELVCHQLAPYAMGANTTISGPNVMLAVAEAQALAMVFHELVTNAAKYGALSTPLGRVEVNWNRGSSANSASLSIVWREINGPVIPASLECGYGVSLIRDLIPHELGGSVDLEFAFDGVCCRIEIPLEARARPTQSETHFGASNVTSRDAQPREAVPR
jgi:two-component sensor histidine kinase/integral membrane sensor domain MASE1